MMKIVIGTGPDAATLQRWREEFAGTDLVIAPTGAEQVAAAPGADAYIGRISRAAFLAAGPQLRWVHSTGAGIEGLTAIPELVESDVVVTNTRGGHAPCIAEHTFAMLLTLTRRLPTHIGNQAAHQWRPSGATAGMRELTGATMVVIGMGNIGRAISRRAVAFDMRVIGVDAFPGEVPPGVEAIWGIERLDDALREADVAVVATPYTAETRDLMNAERIGLIQAGGYLLAISRGGIVDEDALVVALHGGTLAGAGLDVMAEEPVPPDSPLWDAPNLILTPHCSGASDQTRARVASITEDNLRRFIVGEPLANVCNKRAGF